MRVAGLLLLMLSGCQSVEPRAAPSSYGCMKTVRDDVMASLQGANDKHLHCMVSANIARRCSVTEAYLAGIGKELADIFAPHGDAEWADWQADRTGVACGRNQSGEAVERCCMEHLP